MMDDLMKEERVVFVMCITKVRNTYEGHNISP